MLRIPLGSAGAEAFLAAEPGADFALHWHEEWSIGAVLEGACEFVCDGRRGMAAAGDVVLMPPYALHTAGVARQGFGMVMLYVPHAWVTQRFGWPPDERAVLCWNTRRDPLAATALAAAVALPDGDALAGVLDGLLRQACGEAQVPLRPPARDARIQGICDMLADAGEAVPPPAALAARLGLSRERFQRLFRTAVGVTPAHYARLARITQAKRLLGQGCPVADAAAQCGFADQAHFSRWFRRCFGVTPGGYMAAR